MNGSAAAEVVSVSETHCDELVPLPEAEEPDPEEPEVQVFVFVFDGVRDAVTFFTAP